MKKKNIIKSKIDFTKIINNCPHHKNKYYIIYYLKRDKDNRYGISVPKKTGKAYLRNKIKRQIKNIIDNNDFNIPKAYDYVIIIRKRLIELKYFDMEKELILLINKIGEKDER
ncbi:MAG: ribonuclease P protein component [Bacilli bacterium]|nr:ribonuclease P protein component [Bacilli bacterium]